VVVVTRHPRGPSEASWTDSSALDGADAVVNLAGESLDAGRWTAARKASILSSRIANDRGDREGDVGCPAQACGLPQRIRHRGVRRPWP